MKKKLIAIILCICLISSVCIQPAYAMGAEGIIVGGAGAAGLTLTMPQVALIVAAGFGLIYATQHADEIANGLNEALTNAANNIENGMEQLTTWKEKATSGFVALSSAAPWIIETIKTWISGLYEGITSSPSIAVSGHMKYAAGEEIPGAMFWTSSPTTYTYDVDVNVLRAAKIEEITSNNQDYYSLTSYYVAVSLVPFTGCSSATIVDTTYYYHRLSSSANPPRDEPLAGANLAMYNALLTIPNIESLNNYYYDYVWHKALLSSYYEGKYGSPDFNSSVCPDSVVGGIEGAIDNYGIDNIKVPDLDIGGSKLLVPDNTATGSIDEVLGDVLTRLKQQEMTWEQYMTDVSVGVPTVSIPQEGNPPLDFPITDTGVSDIPIDTPVNPPAGDIVVPEGLEPFTISLKDFFPFCIPFDIADFINVLCAEPEAPSFEWAFPSVDGTSEKLTIDLAPFDSVAQLLRNMELLLFCIGLALMTRNLIRG